MKKIKEDAYNNISEKRRDRPSKGFLTIYLYLTSPSVRFYNNEGEDHEIIDT